MKVIFLDINGVMVTNHYKVLSKKHGFTLFTPSCVEQLKDLLAKTNAKIVVTSTWRIHSSISKLKEIFSENGLEKCIVDKTPVIRFAMRGDEIKKYIEDHKGTEHQVDKFVIIDDDDDMGELSPFLVQTSRRTGLNEKAKNKAIKMLNSYRFR
jgi:diphthamide synthase subunit DPH2